MSTKIQPGIYRNTDGDRFDVTGVAQIVEHEYQGHELVIYRPISDTRPLLACPVKAFREKFTMIQSNQEGPK